MAKSSKIEKELYEEILDGILNKYNHSVVESVFKLYETYTKNNEYNEKLFKSAKFLIEDYKEDYWKE